MEHQNLEEQRQARHSTGLNIQEKMSSPRPAYCSVWSFRILTVSAGPHPEQPVAANTGPGVRQNGAFTLPLADR